MSVKGWKDLSGMFEQPREGSEGGPGEGSSLLTGSSTKKPTKK